MKKKYIIVIVVILCALVSGLLIIYPNNNKSSKKEEITQINYEQEDIDWSKYETHELELTDSITIKEPGVYYLTGTIKDGLITINTDGSVKLILKNASITNSNGPAIYVEKAQVTYIELEENTENILIDGSSSELDGTIYSKDDLIIEGDGKLNITANNQDGIVSKDNLVINSGNIVINSKDDGIRGKDSVVIKDGNIQITSEGDGIKTTNDKEDDKGNILIEGGNIVINSKLDGIQAENILKITGGTFDITTGSGSSVKSTNSMMSQKNNTEESKKGLKASGNIEITGGTFNLNTEDDAIHSNSSLTISGGDYTISSGDDGIHADSLLEINDGTFNINASEGIEGTYVKINEGYINISSSDDGINAGHKSDEYSVTIEINGGNITIKMDNGDTDGIDSNGNLYINGGTIDITANSPFDYDGEAKYSGGTIIVNGETTNTITNQMMTGPGRDMNRDNQEGGMNQAPKNDMNRGGRNNFR